MRVAPVSQETIEAALQMPYEDFEDAVVMMAGVGVGADFVVTRNLQDFRYGPLPAITPAELLSRL
jgi:hypothetical protein